jgi:hypothetical protein
MLSDSQTYKFNLEEGRRMSQQWKESITVLIYKRDDKTDCSNCREISLLPTTCKILSNTLVSRLTPYVKGITDDYQCGF